MGGTKTKTGEAVIWEVFPEVVLEDRCNLGMRIWTKGPSGEAEREKRHLIVGEKSINKRTKRLRLA